MKCQIEYRPYRRAFHPFILDWSVFTFCDHKWPEMFWFRSVTISISSRLWTGCLVEDGAKRKREEMGQKREEGRRRSQHPNATAPTAPTLFPPLATSLSASSLSTLPCSQAKFSLALPFSSPWPFPDMWKPLFKSILLHETTWTTTL